MTLMQMKAMNFAELPSIQCPWNVLILDLQSILKQESLDNVNLFSIITIMSFFLLTPVTLFVEGTKLTPAFVQSAVSMMLEAHCIFTYMHVNRHVHMCVCNIYTANLSFCLNDSGSESSTNIYKIALCWAMFSCLSTGKI